MSAEAIHAAIRGRLLDRGLGLSTEGTPASLLPPISSFSRVMTAGIVNGEPAEFDLPAQEAESIAAPEDEDPRLVNAEPGSILEVMHLDEVLDTATGQWNMKPTPASATTPPRKGSKYDAFAFTVIRRFTPTQSGGSPQPFPALGRLNKQTPTSYTVSKVLEIHSEGLRKVGKEVIGQVQGVSWTAKPLRVTPQILLGWLSELQSHAVKLTVEFANTDEDSPVHLTRLHLQHLLDYLTAEYASELESLSSLLDNGEITFDLLWALYVPKKTILHVICPTTSEPRACRLVQAEKCQKSNMLASSSISVDFGNLSLGFDSLGGGQSTADNSKIFWRLVVEYLETEIGPQGVQFGYAFLGSSIEIPGFTGTKKIKSLGVYPMGYYAGPGGPDGLKERLVERGTRWASLAGGVHHLAYKGIAYQWKKSPGGSQCQKFSVDSRVMIDRKTFADSMPNYDKMSYVSRTLSGIDIDRHAMRTSISTGVADQEKLASLDELTDEYLMLASPSLYGFSLADKIWLEFTLDFVQAFTWNPEAYENLVIPPGQKKILTTLVEAHSSETSAEIDDFVAGKGLGLVINLYGNPGTGKSLTAEAMSEYLKKPLYIVGAGELGTNASKVDGSLTGILKISATWGAVVLIDEADVFLEERALHHIERNAMVAVFLRHLEYFRGILFLTTNRVRVFDEAFQSRIHVSLRYHDLTADSRRKIWIAFLKKAHGDIPDGGLSRDELRDLGEKKINGRQIKNVVKTANALAKGCHEKLGYSHLLQVLEMMEQFDASHTMYQ